MAGYGPPDTSFSQGLKRIGDQLTAHFGATVDVRYMFNVMDIGYAGGTDIPWLVDAGLLTVGYATLSAQVVPELEVAALPFVFSDTASARAAMDGPLGQAAARNIEAQLDVVVLGFFENGFRHISNNIRPVHSLADMRGLKIRVLPVQQRTFELLGADPQPLPLDKVVAGLESGELDGQENPFANAVTYGLHTLQRYHTATYHSYLSRAILVHRPTFEAWPAALQAELRSAAIDAIALQRRLKDDEEIQAAAIIEQAGGEIVELTPAARTEFVAAVAPLYAEAREQYAPSLLALVGR
jgi:TRAP-type C4-dicarboxylate transport system substrate-binding protein